MKESISYQDALRVIKRLLEVSEERNEPLEEPVVMVGGTAMAAHGFRKESYDVDLYARDFSLEAVHQVEQEFKAEYSPNFRLDITSVENRIIQEELLLKDCANLLERRVPLADWPREVRAAFLLALHVKGEGREAYKAHRTARHLRLDRESLPGPPDESPTALRRRCAERIRDDLPSLARLGAGSYL